MGTKNLGLVQAIQAGTTPPSNTKMLWYDTNSGVNLQKYYNLISSSWVPLTSGSNFSNIIFVDSITGSDILISVRGQSGLPYKTIEFAVVNAISGNLIWVMSGIYEPLLDDAGFNNLAKDGVDLFFEPGTIINFLPAKINVSSSAIFDSTGFIQATRVLGFGRFNNTATSSPSFYGISNSSIKQIRDVIIEFDELRCSNSYGIIVSSPDYFNLSQYIKIKGNKLINSGNISCLISGFIYDINIKTILNYFSATALFLSAGNTYGNIEFDTLISYGIGLGICNIGGETNIKGRYCYGEIYGLSTYGSSKYSINASITNLFKLSVGTGGINFNLKGIVYYYVYISNYSGTAPFGRVYIEQIKGSLVCTQVNDLYIDRWDLYEYNSLPKVRYNVSSVIATSIQINDGTVGGYNPVTITESDITTYNTKALMAKRISDLINANSDLQIKVTQDFPNIDTSFIISSLNLNQIFTVVLTNLISYPIYSIPSLASSITNDSMGYIKIREIYHSSSNINKFQTAGDTTGPQIDIDKLFIPSINIDSIPLVVSASVIINEIIDIAKQTDNIKNEALIEISSGGTLTIGKISNRFSNLFSNCNCIKFTQGDLILNSSIIKTNGNIDSLPIYAGNPGLNLKILQGGLSTNYITDSLLLAKKQKLKYFIIGVVASELIIDDGTGGIYNPVAIAESDITTYNTKALMAQRIGGLITANSDIQLTVSQDNPGTDEYFYLEADVAGVPFISTSFVNIISENIRQNSYEMTNLTVGLILANTNV